VPYGSDFEDEAVRKLTQCGVVVLENVFTPEECAHHREQLVETLLGLSDGVTREELVRGGDELAGRLLPTARAGMYGSRLSNSTAMWSVRTQRNVRIVFEALYSKLRGEPVTKLVSSIDTVEIRPDGQLRAGRAWGEAADRPHLNTTKYGNPYSCIMGQAILGGNISGVRVSPGSHHVYEDVLRTCAINPGDDSDWCAVDDAAFDAVRELITEEAGGVFQMPIAAPEGSLVLWLASTLHSARSYVDPEAVNAAKSKSKRAAELSNLVSEGSEVVEKAASTADNTTDVKAASSASPAAAPAATTTAGTAQERAYAFPKKIPGLLSANAAKRSRRRARKQAMLKDSAATDAPRSVTDSASSGSSAPPHGEAVPTAALACAGTADVKVDPYAGWRIAVNLCFQPAAAVPPAHIRRIASAYTNNLGTNHNGRCMFPAIPPTHDPAAYTPFIQNIVRRPNGLGLVDESFAHGARYKQPLTPEVQALISYA
jgi:hypothetical protein